MIFIWWVCCFVLIVFWFWWWWLASGLLVGLPSLGFWIRFGFSIGLLWVVGVGLFDLGLLWVWFACLFDKLHFTWVGLLGLLLCICFDGIGARACLLVGFLWWFICRKLIWDTLFGLFAILALWFCKILFDCVLLFCLACFEVGFWCCGCCYLVGFDCWCWFYVLIDLLLIVAMDVACVFVCVLVCLFCLWFLCCLF